MIITVDKHFDNNEWYKIEVAQGTHLDVIVRLESEGEVFTGGTDYTAKIYYYSEITAPTSYQIASDTTNAATGEITFNIGPTDLAAIPQAYRSEIIIYDADENPFRFVRGNFVVKRSIVYEGPTAELAGPTIDWENITGYSNTAASGPYRAGDGITFGTANADGSIPIEASSAGGDVSAAANLTDNAVVRGNGGAKGVQTSGVLIDDSDNVSGVGNLTLTGNVVVGGTVDGVNVATLNSTVNDNTTAAAAAQSTADQAILDAAAAEAVANSAGMAAVAAQATADAALPKAGGAMTGTLDMNSNDIENVGEINAALLASPNLDISGDISVSGTVDGVDVAALGSTVSGHTTSIGTNSTNISTNASAITALETKLFQFALDYPTASESISLGTLSRNAATVTAIKAWVIGGTSCTASLEHRAATTPATSGTAIGSATVADTDTQSQTGLSVSVAAGRIIHLTTSAISGTPSQLVVEIQYGE